MRSRIFQKPLLLGLFILVSFCTACTPTLPNRPSSPSAASPTLSSSTATPLSSTSLLGVTPLDVGPPGFGGTCTVKNDGELAPSYLCPVELFVASGDGSLAWNGPNVADVTGTTPAEGTLSPGQSITSTITTLDCHDHDLLFIATRNSVAVHFHCAGAPGS